MIILVSIQLIYSLKVGNVLYYPSQARSPWDKMEPMEGVAMKEQEAPPMLVKPCCGRWSFLVTLKYSKLMW
jgi:hypothetical protein